jgi:hypothetical protein
MAFSGYFAKAVLATARAASARVMRRMNDMV